jgi:hypothetical protein
MNTFKDAVLNTRAQYLKHMGIADRYHTLWDLLEKSEIAITIIGFLLSTATLVAVEKFDLGFYVWCALVLTWFLPPFLIEIAINMCKTRMQKHLSQAAVLARWMKDFGINPPIL